MARRKAEVARAALAFVRKYRGREAGGALMMDAELRQKYAVECERANIAYEEAQEAAEGVGAMRVRLASARERLRVVELFKRTKSTEAQCTRAEAVSVATTLNCSSGTLPPRPPAQRLLLGARSRKRLPRTQDLDEEIAETARQIEAAKLARATYQHAKRQLVRCVGALAVLDHARAVRGVAFKPAHTIQRLTLVRCQPQSLVRARVCTAAAQHTKKALVRVG
eukprot:COSAG01_NODE_251_length_20305_cov_5.846447_8_plen_223_part_00